MFLGQIKQVKLKKKKAKKLHLSAAQQLVASQEPDGHFDAFQLSFRMARVWEKLGIPTDSMPTDIVSKRVRFDTNGDTLYSAPAAEELSIDPLDATVFVLRLFELYLKKSGCDSNSKQRDQVLEWFGSGGILRDRWFDKAKEWLTSKRVDWKMARSSTVEIVVEKWFDVESKCKHKGTFINTEKLQAKQDDIGKKFEASQIESLQRNEKWICCTSKNINSVQWKRAIAVGWCMGGEGGAYPVRFGENEKLMVKSCNDVGDVIAEQFAKMVGIRTAPTRFISQASEEYSKVEEALYSLQSQTNQR